MPASKAALIAQLRIIRTEVETLVEQMSAKQRLEEDKPAAADADALPRPPRLLPAPSGLGLYHRPAPPLRELDVFSDASDVFRQFIRESWAATERGDARPH